MQEWGFLRETSQKAAAAGRDKDTGLCRTGLDTYLAVIFPETDDWIHDQRCGFRREDGKASGLRPDYRSDSLRMIVEFDGLQHYTSPDQCHRDVVVSDFYRSHGYRVVRIPYFIQLTNVAVRQLFDREVDQPLFDPSIPSMGPLGRNTPAYLCPAGVRRMGREFTAFPDQYEVNMAALRAGDREFTEWELLRDAYVAAGSVPRELGRS